MASYDGSVSDNINGFGGFGGFGGIGGIILLLLFLGFLFKGHHGGHDGGHGHHEKGGHRSWYPDEGNWEQETHLLRDQHAHDDRNTRDSYRNCETTRKEGEKTRALIEANFVKELERKIVGRDMKINTLQGEMFATALNGKTMGAIDHVMREIAALKCGLPVMPRVEFATRQACTAPAPRCDIRRGGCGEGEFEFA